MILGVVNRDLEASVSLFIRGENGREIQIEPVIDTGFSGFLTLPSALVASLALTWRGREDALLGDGSIHTFDTYAVAVIWDGVLRTVEVNLTETIPLIAMAMLFGHELYLNIVNGGEVTIRRDQ